MRLRYSERSEGRQGLPRGVVVVSGPATTAPPQQRGRVAAAGTLRTVQLPAAPPTPLGSARGRPPARGKQTLPLRLGSVVREEAGEGEKMVEQRDQEAGEFGASSRPPSDPSAQGSNTNGLFPTLWNGNPSLCSLVRQLPNWIFVFLGVPRCS